MSLPGWEDVERRHILLTGLRAVGTSLLVLVVYFVVPINRIRMVGSCSSLGRPRIVRVALTYEVRAVMRSSRPILRAADALALVIPIFMVVFAWTYLTLVRSDPGAFSQSLTRIGALYFTVTVFSTVGFGDITPDDRSRTRRGHGADAVRSHLHRSRGAPDPRGGARQLG